MNTEYTNSWIIDFDNKKLGTYHKKFHKQFEKNIKFRQQVRFISKYLHNDMKWLDAPIGSGRLMDELKCNEMFGFDKSPAFIDYNKAKNIKTIQGDIFDMPFVNEFDLVTCLHTVFAFDNFKEILKQLIGSLREDGILIVDIVNQRHIEFSNNSCTEYPYNSGMTKEQITEFFESLNCQVLEIEPHDILDNRFVVEFFNSGNRVIRLFKRALHRLLNILYFKLRLASVVETFAQGYSDKYYTKYLIAVRKK